MTQRILSPLLPLTVLFLFSCAGNQSKLGMNLNKNMDFTSPVPSPPNYPEIYNTVKEHPEKDISVFAKMVFDKKFSQESLNRSTQQLIDRKVRPDRAKYLVNKNAWEIVQCETDYIRAFAADPELHIISDAVFEAIEQGKGYPGYFKAFEETADQWVNETNVIDKTPTSTLSRAATRYINLVEEMTKCMWEDVQEPLVIGRQ